MDGIYRPTNSLLGSNSSRDITSMPCFFMIGTTFAAMRVRKSRATSSSGPLRGVMKLRMLVGGFGDVPYSVVGMAAMVVVAVDAYWHYAGDD
jgi:hypothetical protein